MSFQWLEMRINEEKERRQREARILERLPLALEELHRNLKDCVDAYADAFGPDSAEIGLHGSNIRLMVREKSDAKSQQVAEVEVNCAPAIPGFQIERAGEVQVIEVGVLPGDKMFFRDRESDQYINMEELTRRILDRALFPKLKE